jgi:hypothetical protein
VHIILTDMKLSRKLILVLLLMYASLTLGVYFHSHVGPQHTAKCQICQHSQLDQEQVFVSQQVVENIDYGICIPETIVSARINLTLPLCGRAPPTS